MTRLEAKLMPGRHGSWAKHENMAEMARDGTCKVSNGFRGLGVMRGGVDKEYGHKKRGQSGRHYVSRCGANL